ncbi:uncharacterized protein LOC111717868 [Eurytemora carolleeae]|uniref:uncharacterized protein LOC111717868 n=1 Tax=Eurytemora carolleeae TaxID=1294199 RepID=UPI000C78710F|nr:uncharacterized protein LOC111717868 [Eurytemora carolleeae]|eukprot:XP_023349091.1 uncharacterized protein LOC111717868 [Eurytemora affinis]
MLWYYRNSYNGTDSKGEVIPSGPSYSTFYVFANKFGFEYNLNPAWECTAESESVYSDSCRKIIDGEVFMYIEHANVLYYGSGKGEYFSKVNLIPIINSGVTLICPLPAKLTNMMQILNIFTFRVWLAVFGATVLSVLFLYLLLFLDSTLLNYDMNISLPNIFLYFFGAYFQEPLTSRLRKGKRFVQCFQFFWLLYTFFIVAAWQCDLRANLMATEYEPEISSMAQMADKSNFVLHQTRDFMFEEIHSQKEIDKLKAEQRYIVRK